MTWRTECLIRTFILAIALALMFLALSHTGVAPR